MNETATLIVDAAIVVTLVELAVLVTVLRRRRGTASPSPLAVAANISAGLCLMLALRGALGGIGWHWIAVALVAAGACHVADLVARWPRRP